MLSKIEGSFSIQKISQLLIAVAAIVHLIFNYIHTNALLLLEDEICGFLMFMFILIGLVTLFEVTQIKNKFQIEYITAAFCLITDYFGYKLVSIYQYAIQNQRALDPAPVQTASVFSMAIMAVFAVAGVLLVIDGAARQVRRHG